MPAVCLFGCWAGLRRVPINGLRPPFFRERRSGGGGVEEIDAGGDGGRDDGGGLGLGNAATRVGHAVGETELDRPERELAHRVRHSEDSIGAGGRAA